MEKNFNQKVKEWRKEAGLTLEDVAKQLNMTPQAVSLYENEKRVVSFDTLQLFAAVFGKEIVVNFHEKGIPLTPKQRSKVKNICKYGESVRSIYEELKKTFAITEEELTARKLFDDMTMDDYIRYSPIAYENGAAINLHQEEVFFYYYCQGAEFLLDNGNVTGVAFPNDIPVFTPPRIISEDGFITEQRRRLLPLLNECFGFHTNERFTYKYLKLKREIGF